MRALLSSLACILTFTLYGINAQFTHLTTSVGLAHNHVSCILADRNGMMWFGTSNGVCRYDGYSMKVYTQSKSDFNGLPDNFISALFQSADGDIWIGSDKGAACYSPLFDKVTSVRGVKGKAVTSFAQNSSGVLFCVADGKLYRLNTENRFVPVIRNVSREHVATGRVIAVDNKDQLWFGLHNKLSSLDSNFCVHNQIPVDDTSEGSAKSRVLDIYVDKDNNIWAGTNGGGIICFNQSTMTVSRYNNSDGLVNNVVRAVSQDARGRIWCGTERGISIMQPDGRFDTIRQDLSNRFALNDNAIYDIIPDAYDNMWVGTYFGGVNIFLKDYEALQYYPPGIHPRQLKGKAVRQMAQQNDSILWIATEDGGLNRLNRNTGIISKLELPFLKSNNVHSLVILHDNLWIASFIDGLTRYNLTTHNAVNYNTSNSILPNNNVFSLCNTGDTLWVGTSQGLCLIDSRTGEMKHADPELLRRGFVYNMTKDKEGALWCGMRSKGLIYYNPRTGVQKNWSAGKNPHSLADDFVTFILNDSKNNIYIGTNNGGLYRYNRSTVDFYSFADEGKLDESCICALVEDKQGKIWITTIHGLYIYDPSRETVSKFRMTDLMSVNYFNYTSAFKANDGSLFFGSVNGMLSFQPEEISMHVVHPKVMIRSIIVGDKEITLPDSVNTITLSHSESELVTIEFAGINPAVSGLIEYAIKMDGLNHNWTQIGSQRSIVLSNLKPGKYTLCVKATSDSGAWSDDYSSLQLIVKPPFYATWWAYLLYFIIFLLVIWGIFLYLRRKWRLRNELEEQRRDTEQAQALVSMKNDFFSNVSHEFRTPLSLIIAPVKQMLDSSSVSGEMRDSLKMILRNSQSLMSSVNDLIAFNKSDVLKEINLRPGNPLTFVSELSAQFLPLAESDGVKFTYDVEDWDEEVYYSRTVVKAVVNNLLSNALKFTAKGGSVKLKAQYVRGDTSSRCLEIKVSDTGCGMTPEVQSRIFDKYYQAEDSDGKRTGWGLGLPMVRNLVILHKGTVTVKSEPGKGTVFTVRLNVCADDFHPDRLINDGKYEEQGSAPLSSRRKERKEDGSGSGTQEHPRILIVEDNADMMHYLQSLFEKNGYDVLTASNGKEAMEIMTDDNIPDAVVSDVMMPEMDGIELCTRIKSDLRLVHIPVILLTAKTGPNNALKGYETGADAYVEKPFDPSALLYQVRNILRMRDSNRKHFSESGNPNIEIMANNKYDRKLLKDVKEVVEANIGNSEFCINDVLLAVGVSRTVLHVKLKSLLNMSIGDYISEMRIARAKEMLLRGETITDTAYATGYANPGYFSKSFKKKEGITPSEFIKQHKQNNTDTTDNKQ